MSVARRGMDLASTLPFHVSRPSNSRPSARVIELLGSNSPIRRRKILGYGVAVGLWAVALALRFQIAGALPPGFPYLTFFPAVVVTAFLAGTGPGVLCAILSGLAAWWFFIPPVESFAVTGQTTIALGFYAFIVTVDISLIHLAARALSRLEGEQALTASLHAQQQTMFEELQHRVANNMTFIASLLQLQKRKVRDDPSSASGALDEARERLETMAQIHRRLHDPAQVDLPVGAHLEALTRDILGSAGARDVVLEVRAVPISLDITRLTVLSLLVAEIVTNSAKHAFSAGQGRLTMTLAGQGARMTLDIDDAGPGFSDAAPKVGSLGARITQGLARQLGGELVQASAPGGGARSRLTFPL